MPGTGTYKGHQGSLFWQFGIDPDPHIETALEPLAFLARCFMMFYAASLQGELPRIFGWR